MSAAKKAWLNRQPKHCAGDGEHVAIPQCCSRKCCVIFVWQRESCPDIWRVEKVVAARKVRCMRGQKFFCPEPAGSGWTRRTVFFAMTISFLLRLDYGRRISRRSAEVFITGI